VGLTCVLIIALLTVGIFVNFQAMSTLYSDTHGRTHKRYKVEATVAIERISHRKIVIEHGVLKSNIRVHHFQFIYQIFHENKWLSIFDAANIYLGLVYKFYMSLEVLSSHYNTPYVETKVRGTTLHITPAVISEVIGILVTSALNTPFPDLAAKPPRE